MCRQLLDNKSTDSFFPSSCIECWLRDIILWESTAIMCEKYFLVHTQPNKHPISYEYEIITWTSLSNTLPSWCACVACPFVACLWAFAASDAKQSWFIAWLINRTPKHEPAWYIALPKPYRLLLGTRKHIKTGALHTLQCARLWKGARSTFPAIQVSAAFKKSCQLSFRFFNPTMLAGHTARAKLENAEKMIVFFNWTNTHRESAEYNLFDVDFDTICSNKTKLGFAIQ